MSSIKNNPLVSILVPIYGVEKYIDRCARSLFEQTYHNIEYIFVNDCTMDSSIEILKEVIKRYSNRVQQVRIINHEKNCGLAVARNTAVSVSQGDFIMHVDSDDWIEAECVTECVNRQKKNNADIVRCGVSNDYPRKSITVLHPHYQNGNELCMALLRGQTMVNVWGTLYRRELYIENHIHVKEGVNIAEDLQVTPVLAYYAHSVDYIDKPIYHYNLANQNSYVHGVSEKMILQLWTSIDILESFFLDKGADYILAFNTLKFKRYNEIMKCTSQKRELKYYFQEARLRSKLIPKSSRVGLSFPNRIINILGNYELVRLYIKIIRFFRKNPMLN